MNLHYCIMQVDDRCSSNVENTKRVMDSVGATFIDRNYFSWMERDPQRFLAKRGVRTDNWLECSHRGLPPLVGELGHLSSIVDLLDDLSNRDVEQALVFEDDCIITEEFTEIVGKATSYEFDIFHFSYFKEQWQMDGRAEHVIDDFAVQAHFKKGLMYAALYSKSGINRILRALERIGAIGAIDLSIDEYCRMGLLDNLCVNPENVDSLLTVESLSTIDPENYRHT